MKKTYLLLFPALAALVLAGCTSPRRGGGRGERGSSSSQVGTSESGTSEGGTSQGGTSEGGTSQGGTSQGGTSQGGTSQGGTSQSGDVVSLTFNFVTDYNNYKGSFPYVDNDTGVDDSKSLGNLPIISNGCFSSAYQGSGYVMMKNKDRSTVAFLGNKESLGQIISIEFTCPTNASTAQSYDVSFGNEPFYEASTSGTSVAHPGGTVSANGSYGYFAISTIDSSKNGQLGTLTINYIGQGGGSTSQGGTSQGGTSQGGTSQGGTSQGGTSGAPVTGKVIEYNFVSDYNDYKVSFPYVENDTPVDDSKSLGSLPIISNGCFSSAYQGSGYVMMKNKDRSTVAFLGNKESLGQIISIEFSCPTNASAAQSYDVSFGNEPFYEAQSSGVTVAHPGGVVNAQGVFGYFAISTKDSSKNGQLATLKITYNDGSGGGTTLISGSGVSPVEGWSAADQAVMNQYLGLVIPKFPGLWVSWAYDDEYGCVYSASSESNVAQCQSLLLGDGWELIGADDDGDNWYGKNEVEICVYSYEGDVYAEAYAPEGGTEPVEPTGDGWTAADLALMQQYLGLEIPQFEGSWVAWSYDEDYGVNSYSQDAVLADVRTALENGGFVQDGVDQEGDPVYVKNGVEVYSYESQGFIVVQAYGSGEIEPVDPVDPVDPVEPGETVTVTFNASDLIDDPSAEYTGGSVQLKTHNVDSVVTVSVTGGTNSGKVYKSNDHGFQIRLYNSASDTGVFTVRVAAGYSITSATAMSSDGSSTWWNAPSEVALEVATDGASATISGKITIYSVTVVYQAN